MMPTFYYSNFSCDPIVNMAFDTWMFKYVLKNPGAVLLRLYTWSKGAITIGYHQHPDRAIDKSKLDGTPLIRRITGGRAVYHDRSELTYSIAINPHFPCPIKIAGSISSVHIQIAKSLQEFLQILGLSSEIIEKSKPTKPKYSFSHTLPCFESHARYELTSNGQKVVASAQRQQDGVLFQHGSIKSSGIVNHPAISFQIDNSSDGIQPLGREKFTSLSERFTESMALSLGLKFVSQELTPDPFISSDLDFSSIFNSLNINPLRKTDFIKQEAIKKSL